MTLLTPETAGQVSTQGVDIVQYQEIDAETGQVLCATTRTLDGDNDVTSGVRGALALGLAMQFADEGMSGAEITHRIEPVSKNQLLLRCDPLVDMHAYRVTVERIPDPAGAPVCHGHNLAADPDAPIPFTVTPAGHAAARDGAN